MVFFDKKYKTLLLNATVNTISFSETLL